MEGIELGSYRLLDELGRGGMGRVYRAYDTATDRIVALKVMPPELAGDEKYQKRFKAEARAAASLNEPHIVPIHGFGEIDGRLYVDMRLIDGRNLEETLRQGPLDPSDAVSVISQVAAALGAAHRIGLVHRDVKPSNILVAEESFAYLIDFGIARGVGESSITSTGLTVGTLAYMAPERFAQSQADQRSDVYSLACVFHECLTGAKPYAGDSLEQQIAGHLVSTPPRPSTIRPTIPQALDYVVAKGLAKNPDERYSTAGEFADAARVALSGSFGSTVAHHPAHAFFPDPATQFVYSTPPTNHYGAPAVPAAPPWAQAQRKQASWWKRHAIAITAVVAVAAIGIALPLILATPRAPRRTTTGTPLLSVQEINRVMGVTNIRLIDSSRKLDDRRVPTTPSECESIDSYVTKAIFAGAGVDSAEQQVLHALGRQLDGSVDQVVAKAPSSEAANRFLGQRLQSWRSCDGKQYETAGQKVIAAIVESESTRISGKYTYPALTDKSYECEQTVGIVGNTIAVAVVCGSGVGPKEKANTIVSQILRAA